jgi:hypothetical protein
MMRQRREAEETAAKRRQRGGSCSPSAGACGRTSPPVISVGIWGIFFLVSEGAVERVGQKEGNGSDDSDEDRE